MEKLIVIVSCYKKDYFLTRVCVASIKYYHPEAEVYLLKDYLAGYFVTVELETAFQVKILELGLKKFGWGAAKVHFILSKKFEGQRVLIIDSDTVFAGRFLANLFQKTKGIDFVVNPQFYISPYEGDVPLHYYNFDNIKKFDSTFTFPGYVFNTGHLIVTPGKISPQDVMSLFDISVFPYYKRLDILPMVDQSLLNYALPKMQEQGLLTMAAEPLMEWSDDPNTKQLDLEKVKEGTAYSFLIHWAGVLRVANLSQMTRGDILLFFEDYYYSKVPMGSLKKSIRRLVAMTDYNLRVTYRKTIKPLISK